MYLSLNESIYKFENESIDRIMKKFSDRQKHWNTCKKGVPRKRTKNRKK